MSHESQPELNFDDHFDQVELLLETLPETPRRAQLIRELDEAENVSQLLELAAKAEKVLEARSLLKKKAGFPKSVSDQKTFQETLGSDELTMEEMQRNIELFRDHILERTGDNIGTGKTAQVYTNPSWPDYCVKIINNPDEYAKGNNVKVEAMLLDELRSFNDSGCRVPRVVLYHMDESTHFYIMEKISGYTLAELLDKEIETPVPAGFDFNTAFANLEVFLKGMHGKDIHHRDFHEGNVMLDIKTNEFVIIDLGHSVKAVLDDNPYEHINESTGEITPWRKDTEHLRDWQRKLKVFFNI